MPNSFSFFSKFWIFSEYFSKIFTSGFKSFSSLMTNIFSDSEIALSFSTIINFASLFLNALSIIEIDSAFRNKEAKLIIVEKLKAISESENIFVIREEKLLKPEVKIFEKYSEKIQNFEKKEKELGIDQK